MVNLEKRIEMMTGYKYILILLVLLSNVISINGQQAERFLEARGMAELDDKPLANVTATLYEGVTKVNSMQTGTDGTFSFRLEANKNYIIEVSKNGLVTKKINFNTNLPDEESGKWVSEFGMVMVRPCEGVDYSVLQKPVDIVRFNAKRRSFESDKDYNEQMMPKLQDINIKSANCLEEKFDQLIKKADQLVEQKDYESARSAYQQAAEIMPGVTYPQKKVAEIDAMLEKQQRDEEKARQQAQQQSQQQARQQEVDNAYQAAVAQADALMKEKKYAEAKEAYAKALNIKPSESYPRVKSQEIDKAVQQQAQAKQDARKEELSRNLDSYLDEGDAQFKAKNYDAARAAYANALRINPSDAYTKQQLARIDKLIVNEETARQKTVEDGYQNAIDRANTAMAQQQYGLAREQYQQALTFKPGDAFAQARVSEAVRLEKEQVNDKTAAEQQNKLYQEAIASADRLMQAKDLQGALSGYHQALEIKPGDAYALQRIKGVENALAAEQAARDKALAEEQASKQKALDEAYQNAMAQGNAALFQKQYGPAKEQYQKALGFKPDDLAAKNKIAEADMLLKQEQDHLAAEQAKKKQYDETLARADNLFSAKDYSNARLAFGEALRIIPSESYPVQKISEIDKLLADQQKELADKQAKDKAYNDAVKNGDMYLSLKKYDDAKTEYNKALLVRPAEVYPKSKLSEIENIIKAEQLARTEAKAKEDGYNAAMNEAGSSFAKEQWTLAREQYQKALGFKPDDPAAMNKIAEIDNLLKQEKDRLAAEQAKKKQYDETIARADNLFSARDYSNARLAFGEASRIMPSEAYPKQKIDEIDTILADMQKATEEKQARDKAYSDAVKNGDMYFSLKNYNDARNEFTRALSVKPNEVYPKNKIAEIDNILKVEKQALAEAKAKEDAYNAAISAGNEAYSQKKYTEAKGSYNQALKLKPEDTYARDQIVLIDKLLADMEKQKRDEEARQKQYNEFVDLADKAFNAANYPSAKEYYQKALAVIPDSPYPKQKLARIEEINKILAQQQSAAKQPSKKSISSTTPLAQLNFKNDAERDIYLNDLKKKYPEGVTLEIYKEKYQETRRYIVVRDDVASEYRDILILSYGGHEYSKDGRTVTQMYFEQQVKSRPGEYYNETTFE
jgi:tetratricopeptide (TPR) repeat protein